MPQHSDVQEQRTELRAPCKVNLQLTVGPLRPDGYHDLDTLFLPLPEPHDLLRLRLLHHEPGVVRLTCSDPALAGEDNLVVRAARRFAEASTFAPGVEIELIKRIPAGAGLGGGSSDAACVLGWLNARAAEAGQALPAELLNGLAAKLGADVPFFLLGSPAWAGGIGEQLEPAEVDLAGITVLLLTPRVHVATAAAYQRLDALRQAGKAAQSVLTATTERVRCPFCLGAFVLRNDLEAAVFDAYPELARVKERLLGLGAAGALMSGSGASVFGLFREESAARHAAREFEAQGVRAYLHRQ